MMASMNDGRDIGRLIATAFQAAKQRNPELARKWIEISARIGGRVPNSMMVSVQRAGDLDLAVRAMEDSHRDPSADADIAEGFQLHYHMMLAELWIGSVYEVLRLLKERGIAPEGEQFDVLAHDFRLLRIPLEKHEIAGDHTLMEALQMKRVPGRGDSSDVYVYSKEDTAKAHIMPCGVSARGSVMWQVIDLRNRQNRWVELRDLSDRMIEVWGGNGLALGKGNV